MLEKTKLLKWLLARIGRAREMDSNKLYASELLAILLQASPANQKRFAAANGVDAVLVQVRRGGRRAGAGPAGVLHLRLPPPPRPALLDARPPGRSADLLPPLLPPAPRAAQAVAPYRKDDPKGGEEEEYLQNCFDVLCSALMSREGRAEFHRSQGTDLMVLILKGKRLARYGALKTLDFATTKCAARRAALGLLRCAVWAAPRAAGPAGAAPGLAAAAGVCRCRAGTRDWPAPSRLPWPLAPRRQPEVCERFVDQQGLPRLFPIFMCKNRVKGPAGEHDVDTQVRGAPGARAHARLCLCL